MSILSDLPENHGLSSEALLEFLAQIDRLGLDVNSFMLLQNGKATARFWRKPYRPESPQLLFSLSKSFTSIAAGIAWDEGRFELTDQVISFFPEKLPKTISENLAKMTVHHLLSMNAGHHDNIYGQVAHEQDWAKAFLAQDVEHEPGTFYRYSTHCTYMLSAIIERVTGGSLVDFLMPRLFEPLGIPRPSWETCPLGMTAGGMGLSISTEGIAKFGQMLLNRGMYEGKRIVSERYIELATTEQSDNRKEATRIDSAQGYGYQFHLCRRGCYRSDGAFGQLCFVAPKEKIVIAATSSFRSMNELQTLLDLIYKFIIDRLGRPDISPAQSTEDYSLLEQHLADRSCPVPTFRPVPNEVPELRHRRYAMNESPSHLQELFIHMTGEQVELQLRYRDYEDRLLFDLTKAVHTRGIFTKDLSLHEQDVVTYAYWEDKDTLELVLFYIETPYKVSYTLKFKENSLMLRFRMNVSMGMTTYEADGALAST